MQDPSQANIALYFSLGIEFKQFKILKQEFALLLEFVCLLFWQKCQGEILLPYSSIRDESHKNFYITFFS